MEKVVHTSTAAVGMVYRKGVGKVRNIEVQYPWIQDEVYKKKMAVHKIGARENLADMLTKGLRRELLDEHVAFVNGHIRGKGDQSALTLNAVGASDAWAKGRYTNGGHQV